MFPEHKTPGWLLLCAARFDAYFGSTPTIDIEPIGIAKDHIQEIFGCGLYTINNSTNMSTYSNGSYFFSHNSSSKVLLANDPNCDTNEPPLASGGSLGVKGVHSTRFSLAWRLESRKPLCYNTVKNLTVNKQTEGGGL